MKNIAVKKKLLMGFGIVIMMIVIILGLTVATTVSRNRDLERVKVMGELQADANNLLNDFNLARVEIRTLFTSITAESEYYLAKDYLASCVAYLEDMRLLSARLDGYLASEIGELEKMFADINNAVDQVGDNDELVIAALDDMTANGQQMSASSLELFDQVTSLTIGIGAGDAASGMERVESVVVPTKHVGDMVDDLRVLSRNLLTVQDTAVLPELFTGLDNVETQGNDIRSILTTAEARTAVDTLLAAAEGFRGSIQEAERIIALSDTEIATARTIFLNLNDKVNAFADTISLQVAELNDHAVSISTSTMIILIIVGAAAAAFSVAVALVLSGMLTRPLAKMKAVLTQAGVSGDLNYSEEVRQDVLKEAEAKDELGQSLHAFVLFIERIKYVAGCLERVADKDLTVDIELLSEEDTMGLALRTMLNNLNRMFAEINSVAKQVSNGAGEIATGAQSLAQGASEQAATVEEISASVTEVTQQTSVSSEMASAASADGKKIREIAEDGNHKMQQMMQSMQSIDDASQAIGRVIKVIDDIAFQTNILALNAAVEAARAGQHGKGFAVVADEVRNLAAKSSDAAKETANLISENAVKTKTGIDISRATAESLEQIIEGIQKTSSDLEHITEQLQISRVATAQVNVAVDQVAQVVQQNSATSQQSAAASEQMSSQAHVLQQLTGEFKIRDTPYSESYPVKYDEAVAYDGDSRDLSEAAFQLGKY